MGKESPCNEVENAKKAAAKQLRVLQSEIRWQVEMTAFCRPSEARLHFYFDVVFHFLDIRNDHVVVENLQLLL